MLIWFISFTLTKRGERINIYTKLSLILTVKLFHHRFFSSSFLATPQHMEFPGQGSYPSHSYDPSHSCSNAGSPTHCARPVIEPATQSSQDAANPVVPQQELHHYRFFCVSL